MLNRWVIKPWNPKGIGIFHRHFWGPIPPFITGLGVHLEEDTHLNIPKWHGKIYMSPGLFIHKNALLQLGVSYHDLGYVPYMYAFMYAKLFWYILYIYMCTYSSIQYISLTCQIGPCFSQHHRVPKSYPNYRPLMHRREWQNHQATGFSELFPGIDLRLLTLSQNFRRRVTVDNGLTV